MSRTLPRTNPLRQQRRALLRVLRRPRSPVKCTAELVSDRLNHECLQAPQGIGHVSSSTRYAVKSIVGNHMAMIDCPMVVSMLQSQAQA